MRRSSTLPPLQALRAFEAVGRLLSFRRAGEELLITQSAVSHHIRELEEMLGCRLFIRRARSIELTAEGAAYHNKIGKGFQLITAATAELRAVAGHGMVRLSVLPSFAANWLVKRLATFQHLHPEITVELFPTLDLADLALGEADLAIRYGAGPWPGVEARLLAQEALAPVVSPSLLADGAGLKQPGDLLAHPLLFTRRAAEWQIWAQAVGIDLDAARIIQLTDYNVVLQAALNGQGVAMGRSRLIEEHLASGRLVRPFDQLVRSAEVAYWLVTPAGRQQGAPKRALAAWLEHELGPGGAGP
ncbi:transcriptional regulator GcvA [Labrys sp. KNU-23]|uniref:transcriptional regulator GcvA n=1 Tax=Labrys sp. KNU-23 TaxID=2789216 RepID=UPI0011ED7D40|nr:transcriptional regulator GcvA [Labrys sp. KNU-23]QEN87628.1 transcriptional regulator GcvA [Labrys sp. KNU-23]